MYQDVLECSITFEICLDVIISTDVLNIFTCTLHVRYNYISLVLLDCSMLLVGAVVLLLLLMKLSLFSWKFLCSILSRTHVGYLHSVRTSIRCCFSVLSSSGLEQTTLILCFNVLITLHFAPIW